MTEDICPEDRALFSLRSSGNPTAAPKVSGWPVPRPGAIRCHLSINRRFSSWPGHRHRGVECHSSPVTRRARDGAFLPPGFLWRPGQIRQGISCPLGDRRALLMHDPRIKQQCQGERWNDRPERASECGWSSCKANPSTMSGMATRCRVRRPIGGRSRLPRRQSRNRRRSARPSAGARRPRQR